MPEMGAVREQPPLGPALPDRELARVLARLRRAGQAARNPENREASRATLTAAMETPELRPEAGCLLGRLLQSDGDLAGAAAAFAKAFSGHVADAALPSWGLAEYLQVLIAGGRDEEALALGRRVVAADMPPSKTVAFTLLADLFVRVDPAAPEIETLLRQAIRSGPLDRLLVERAYDWLRARGSHEEALDWLVTLQENSDRPLRSVLVTLSAHRGPAEVRARFAETLAHVADASPFREVRQLHDALMRLEEPDPADAKVVLADGSQATEIFYQFLMQEPTQLPAFGKHPAIAKALNEHGVDLPRLRIFIEDFMQVSEPAWEAVLESATITEPVAREAYMTAERESGFLNRMAAGNGLAMMDPFTGDILQPFDSVVVFGRSVYSYRGKELFHLVCGKPWTGALGLTVPRLNISIPFGKTAHGLLGADLPNVLATLLRRAARRRAGGETVWPEPGEGPKRIILSVGNTENFAHHVWNFYSALERMAVSGRIERLSDAIFSGTEFFGPLDELFPELKAVGFRRVPKNNVIDPVPYAGDALVMQTGGFLAAASLTERIVATMRARPKSPPRRADMPVLDVSDLPPRHGGAVIWIGFRLRDKAWTEQESGSIHVIRRLSERFGDAVFLLDGFSFPVGHDQISDQWEDVISALRAMGERIKAESGVPDRVVNMVGNTMRESVLWAQETSVYLAPYGTTQHKIGWFTKAPGLVYVPPNFAPRIVARSPACSVSAYGRTPRFIFPDAASAGERRGFNRVRERFQNVALDAEEIAQTLIAMLEEEGFGP